MLPGAATFIGDVVDQLRTGSSVIVAAPTHAPGDLAEVFAETLLRDPHADIQFVHVPGQADPLNVLTEQLGLVPEQWVGWNVEKLFQQLPDGRVIVLDGVTMATWESWRTFLMDFDVASRSHASAQRPVLLVIARGVPHKRLQVQGGALTLQIWRGIFSELDTLIYVDQRLRRGQTKLARGHPLLVRQIAALALWDLDLADFLMKCPTRELFGPREVLQAAREVLHVEKPAMLPTWEGGGADEHDGVQRMHPFVLLGAGDQQPELTRRLWSAQAAELLPLIELRRRELVPRLERQVQCPFRMDDGRSVTSLEELEIGPLAHVARRASVDSGLKERAGKLAKYRNTLAHLSLLGFDEACDSILYP